MQTSTLVLFLAAGLLGSGFIDAYPISNTKRGGCLSGCKGKKPATPGSPWHVSTYTSPVKSPATSEFGSGGGGRGHKRFGAHGSQSSSGELQWHSSKGKGVVVAKTPSRTSSLSSSSGPTPPRTPSPHVSPHHYSPSDAGPSGTKKSP